jgi:hypothetical protein
MKKPISNNNLATFQKYFPIILEELTFSDQDGNEINLNEIKFDEIKINKADLEELLSEYGLSKKYQFFEELSKWLPKLQYYVKMDKESTLQDIEFNQQYFDLFELVMALQDEQIEKIELKYTTNGLMKGKNDVHFISPLKNGKIIISNSVLLGWLGEILYSGIENLNFQDESPKEVVIKKEEKKKGKPNSTYYQALISFGLLHYLNNETELKSGSNFISNDQGKFIYDFLEFTSFLPVESSKVLQEEYIRTLLNNYKGKESFPPFK